MYKQANTYTDHRRGAEVFTPTRCAICGEPLEDADYDAYPVTRGVDDTCCGSCYNQIVLPVRKAMDARDPELVASIDRSLVMSDEALEFSGLRRCAAMLVDAESNRADLHRVLAREEEDKREVEAALDNVKDALDHIGGADLDGWLRVRRALNELSSALWEADILPS